MRTNKFATMTDAWEAAAYDLSRDGMEFQSRAGKCMEILGYSFRLTDPRASWVCSPTRRLARSYGGGELLWYLAGSDDGGHIQAYASSYGQFLNGGRAYGAYGKRWMQYNQLESAFDLMSRDRSTRQAVISCWHPSDIAAAAPGNIKDMPCTLALNFQPRGDVLNLIVTMRSNDWWLGMPYDCWCFTAIQLLLAAALKMKPGFYQHQVGSFHAYFDRWAELDTVTRGLLSHPAARPLNMDLQHGHTDRITCWGELEQQIYTAVAEEHRIRLNLGGPRAPQKAVIDALGGPDSLLSRALIAAATKFKEGSDARQSQADPS